MADDQPIHGLPSEPRVNDFFSLLKTRAHELAADYPFQETDDAFDWLYSITSSLRGTDAANQDCHDEIKRLRGLLGDAYGWLMRIAQHNAAANAALADECEGCDLNVLRLASQGEWGPLKEGGSNG